MSSKAAKPEGGVKSLEMGGATQKEVNDLFKSGEELVKHPEAEEGRSMQEARLFSEARLDSYKQDTEQRKQFAHRIFYMIVCWLVAIFIILLFDGFLSNNYGYNFWLRIGNFSICWGYMPGFKLSDTVVLALIGGTTLNVIGILYLVVQYLFPKRDSSKIRHDNR